MRVEKPHTSCPTEMRVVLSDLGKRSSDKKRAATSFEVAAMHNQYVR